MHLVIQMAWIVTRTAVRRASAFSAICVEAKGEEVYAVSVSRNLCRGSVLIGGLTWGL